MATMTGERITATAEQYDESVNQFVKLHQLLDQKSQLDDEWMERALATAKIRNRLRARSIARARDLL